MRPATSKSENEKRDINDVVKLFDGRLSDHSDIRFTIRMGGDVFDPSNRTRS